MELSQLLNPKQLEAATYLDGHLRIIAGAGSGKTRVVTYRIAYLIEEVGVNPHNILAITFTNKAANEMKTRVENILGTSLGTTICTIHSLCVRVLDNTLLPLAILITSLLWMKKIRNHSLKSYIKKKK